ncbi:TadE/TadG family type IV pilus assembly protein [Streptomyces sp. NPDC037389]|uniref:TadE/TadG family type IV pilus assembly protein n=1 Tax=Streptomyces sp. NPDC037389 TaxID=3155369 RepID=UPI0033F676F5
MGEALAPPGNDSGPPAFEERGSGGGAPGWGHLPAVAGGGKGRVRGKTHHPDDQGSASIEFLGFLPLLLALALGATYLGIAAYATMQAGTAARAAARTATVDDPKAAPAAAARAAVSPWVAARADVDATPCAPGTDRATATVTVDVPPLLPGTGFTVTRSATMACAQDTPGVTP